MPCARFTPRSVVVALRLPLGACCALLGALLFALNIAGLFIPLRNDAIYRDPASSFPNDITLTYDQFRRESPRLTGEGEVDYIVRLTGLVNSGMAHRWLDDGIDTYRMRIPASENYLLYLASYVRPEVYLRYEFADPDRAMERGIGLCSQHALVLATLLKRAGIQAQVVALDGHVVTRAVIADGTRFIADADYGVVLPYSRKTLEADPELARPYYDAALASDFSPATYEPLTDLIVEIYGPEGNRTLAPEKWYPADVAAFEMWAYRLKWPLPLVLFAIGLLGLWRRRVAQLSAAKAPASRRDLERAEGWLGGHRVPSFVYGTVGTMVERFQMKRRISAAAPEVRALRIESDPDHRFPGKSRRIKLLREHPERPCGIALATHERHIPADDAFAAEVVHALTCLRTGEDQITSGHAQPVPLAFVLAAYRTKEPSETVDLAS